MIHERRQLVIQQVIIQRTSRLGIEQQLFRKAETDSHAHTAVYLCLCERRIDQRSRIMGIDDIYKLHLAHRDIHLRFRNGTSEGIGIGFNLGRTLRRQMLTVGQAVQRFR